MEGIMFEEMIYEMIDESDVEEMIEEIGSSMIFYDKVILEVEKLLLTPFCRVKRYQKNKVKYVHKRVGYVGDVVEWVIIASDDSNELVISYGRAFDSTVDEYHEIGYKLNDNFHRSEGPAYQFSGYSCKDRIDNEYYFYGFKLHDLTDVESCKACYHDSNKLYNVFDIARNKIYDEEELSLDLASEEDDDVLVNFTDSFDNDIDELPAEVAKYNARLNGTKIIFKTAAHKNWFLLRWS